VFEQSARALNSVIVYPQRVGEQIGTIPGLGLPFSQISVGRTPEHCVHKTGAASPICAFRHFNCCLYGRESGNPLEVCQLVNTDP
jgi:hypothetical protein